MVTAQMNPIYVDLAGAARLTSLSKRKLASLVEAGRLKSFRVDRRRLYRVEDLVALVEGR